MSKSQISLIRVLLFFVIVASLAISFFSPLPTIESISVWQVGESENLKAKILWQRRIPCFTSSTTSPHGSIAVSSNYVLFHRTCGWNGELTALDLQIGEIIWSIPSRYTYQVGHVNNTFFAIEGDSYITGITTEGIRIWRTVEFPSRSVRYAHSSNNQLLVPSLRNTLIVSPDSGEIIREIDNSNILTLNSQYSVHYTENSVVIKDLSTNNSVFSRQISSSELYPAQARIYAEIYDEIVILYLDSFEISAIGLETGEVLWSKTGNFASIPLLHNGLLYVYENDNRLALYNPLDGTLLGSTILQQEGNNQSQVGVALSASGNFITIAYRDIAEILTLEIDF